MKIHYNSATITDTDTIYTTETKQKLLKNEVNHHSDNSSKQTLRTT